MSPLPIIYNNQDIIVAAVRACRDAIATNSIPAFHKGISELGFNYLSIQPFYTLNQIDIIFSINDQLNEILFLRILSEIHILLISVNLD